MKWRTPIGSRTEGQWRVRDRQVTQGTRILLNCEDNGSKSLSNPTKLILYQFLITFVDTYFVLKCSVLLFNSFVAVKMLSTRKTRQQIKRLLSQLNDSDTDFMIAQNNHETQFENRTNTADWNITLNNTNNRSQVSGSPVDMHTLEKNIADKVRSEVDSVMTKVETRLKDAVWTVTGNLAISRVELGIESVNTSFGGVVDSEVLDPDQRFSRNIECFQMTASNRINSQTDLKRIDETRGSIAVVGGDLTVNERNFDRKPHTHHRACYCDEWKIIRELEGTFVLYVGSPNSHLDRQSDVGSITSK